MLTVALKILYGMDAGEDKLQGVCTALTAGGFRSAAAGQWRGRASRGTADHRMGYNLGPGGARRRTGALTWIIW